jgi:predicted naringenin-chalcone synthase
MEGKAMKTYIHHIEPVAPSYAYAQDYARDRMTGWLPGRRNRRLIHNIYDHSGIDTRHSVLPDFEANAEPVLFHENEEGRVVEPMTGERNRCFQEAAPGLVIEAGKRALAHSEGFEANDITHVITVSCTGFYNPGPDLDLINGLGLKESTERYNIGFMGCYAAFPALRMADQFCRADPEAVVMVVCIELCTLHLQFNEETDSLLANALFADGAAAVLVSARSPASGRPAMSIDSFNSALSPEGAKEMAWEVGNRGFDIRLSSYVPDIIAGNIAAIVDRVLRM